MNVAYLLTVALVKTAIGVFVSLWGVSCPQQAREEKALRAVAILAFAILYYLIRFVYVSCLYAEGPLALCLLTSALAAALFRYRAPYALYLGFSVSLCLQSSQLAVFTIAGTFLPNIDAALASDPWFGVLLELTGALVALLAVWFLRRQALEGARRWIRWPHLVTLALPLALFVFFSAWQMPAFDPRYQPLEIAPVALILVVFMAVVLSILSFFAMFRMSWQRAEIARLETLASERLQATLVRQQEHEELGRFLHDLRNQILAAEATEDERARREHLRSLDDRLSSLHNTRFTGNATLDALLNQKRREAQRSNIDLHITPLALPEGFMASADVCSLFGNALDNALECCQLEPTDSPRFIDLKMARVGEYLSATVANPCSREPLRIETGFLSQKREGTKPGLGIASMRHVAEKHHGVVEFSWDEGTFTVTMLIPWPSPSKS